MEPLSGFTGWAEKLRRLLVLFTHMAACQLMVSIAGRTAQVWPVHILGWQARRFFFQIVADGKAYG